MNELPSLSKLQAASVCVGSGVLPQYEEEREPAEQGTWVHRFLVAAAERGRAAAVAETPEEYRPVVEAIDLDRLPAPGGFAYEVALAYNVDRHEAIEVGRGEDVVFPDMGPGWVRGRVDLLALEGERVVVLDVKTGRGYVPHPARNWQLRAGALAAARCYGADAALVGLVHVPDGSPPRFLTHDIDGFGLDAAAEELRELVTRIREARVRLAVGENVKLRAGAQCRVCPSLPGCPAHADLLLRAARAGDELVDETLAMITDETASRAYHRAKALRALAERIERSVYAWAAEHPVPIGDGQVLGQMERRRVSIDGEIASQVLAKFGPAIADGAMSLKTSKKAIRSALRPVAAQHGIALAELERDALRAIDEMGGLVVRTTYPVTEHAAGSAAEEES